MQLCVCLPIRHTGLDPVHPSRGYRGPVKNVRLLGGTTIRLDSGFRQNDNVAVKLKSVSKRHAKKSPHQLVR